MQLYVKSLITGFPDEWPVIRSSITFLVNALGVENGHGFFHLEVLGMHSTVQHHGVTGLLKTVRIASFWFLLCRKDRVTRV